MDRLFEHGGTTFEWDEAKAAENQRKHGVSFEEAVTVFDDPLFVLQDASRNEEPRDAVIGFSSTGRLLTVVHIEFDGQRYFMINERLKKRLKKDRPSTTITMRIPTDVVESLKAVAPMRGFTAYQTLLKSYISEGLRRDEVQFDQHTARKLAEALKRRGVAEKVLQEAMAEIASDS
jgi:uncharacterized DUF497 family protein